MNLLSQGFERTARFRSEVTYDCRYMVIWSTKMNRNLLDGLEDEVCALLRAEADAVGATVHHCRVSANSVELQVSVSPVFGIHRLVRHLKARTSSQLRGKYAFMRTRVPSVWTSKYLVSTVGQPASREVVDAFILSQKYV